VTSEKDETRERRLGGDGSSGAGGTVVLGLLAPPQIPKEVVEDLAAELPWALSERVSDRVSWEVPTLRDTRVPDVEYGEEGGDETIDDVSEWRRHEGWDLAVCVTDLPLVRSDGRAVVAESCPHQDAALVSLPALGMIRRRRRAREEIVRLVDELFSDDLEPGREGEEDRAGGGIGRVVTSDDDNLQFVTPAGVGKLQLLAGMVRATHPFRVVLGLSYALTAALGTAAFTVITNTIWQLSGALGSVRLLALMLISLVAMVAYFIVVHDMWHRPSRRWGREYTVLLNATTVITLTIGALTFYLALFALTLAAAGLFIEGSVLAGALGHQPGLIDYAALAWIVSSLATLGGTLGSGLQASDDVHEAAYTYHGERRKNEGREQRNDDSENGSG
jgi:hypothetical protein